jgi:hypothetical protein
MRSRITGLSRRRTTLDVSVENESTGIGLYSRSLPDEHPRLGRGGAVERELAMWLELDQDGPHLIRFRLGAPTAPEDEEWVGRASRPLDLTSGVLGCDAFAVSVPPGRYLADVRCYLPSSMASTLLRRSPPRKEGLPDYWRRTRPDEDFPGWLQAGVPPHLDGIADDHGCIDFLVSLTPVAGSPQGTRVRADGTSPWESRRPARCPEGIPAGDVWDPGSTLDPT